MRKKIKDLDTPALKYLLKNPFLSLRTKKKIVKELDERVYESPIFREKKNKTIKM